MPVWASVLIAVIASFASGSFGAWLGAWNDRHERFRDRMIVAADDLVVEASGALIGLRNAIGEVRSATDAARAKQAAEAAWTGRDSVLRRSARVDLLFGPGSETARAATDLVTELAKGCGMLQPPALDAAGAEGALIDAAGHLPKFERAAFEGIRRAAPPSATLRESIRRSISR